MFLKFSGTDYVLLLTAFHWTFTDATVWRTAFTFAVVSTWIIEFCIVLVNFFTIEVDFLHLDWVNLPSVIIGIILDNCLIQRFFNSNAWLCSWEKRLSKWTNNFLHQNFFLVGFNALMVRIITRIDTSDLVWNDGHLADAGHT